MRGLCCLLVCWGLLAPGWVKATHIVGGNLEMRALGGNRYQLALVLLNDDYNGLAAALGTAVSVSTYPKTNAQRPIERFVLRRVSRTPLTFANEACARFRKLGFSTVRYELTVTLDPARYADPAGYRLVANNCCRNRIIENIVRPSASGLVYSLEFPPLAVANSSPVFGVPNGEYVCLGEPFATPYGATDADGDQLRYSLVTPYDRFRRTGNPRAYAPTLVQWDAGFSEQTAIPGNPPLRVDPLSGMLTVTATQLGLFVFCVQVEEFRNGQRIGLVRRDFQLLVVDCPPQPPPKPLIYSTGQAPHVRLLEYCQNGVVELKTAENPGYRYQWQRDGVNLPGATGPAYVASQPGRYTVAVSPAVDCGKTTFSDPTEVRERPGPTGLTIASDAPPENCGQRAITLSAPAGNYAYQWLRNRDTLRGETRPQLTTREEGRFAVLVRDRGTGCAYRPALDVSHSKLPSPRVAFPGKDQACVTVAELSVPADASHRYQWLLDGQPVRNATNASLSARESGLYSVKITSADGACSALSDTVAVQIGDAPEIRFDSIPAICRLDTLVTLRATPGGGVFEGEGVNETGVFDPRQVGVGKFPVTYTLETGDDAASGCPAEARRWAVVGQPADVTLGPDVRIDAGASVPLPARSTSGGTYQWLPPDGLSDPTALSPVASPPRTTTYRLRVTSPTGCTAEGQITVQVVEGVAIPTAFSPNGDGLNDTWEIFGLESYPDAEVRVFNRWGAEIFHSKGYGQPFDGTYAGQLLPVGAYSYSISLGPGKHTYRGVLTVLR